MINKKCCRHSVLFLFLITLINVVSPGEAAAQDVSLKFDQVRVSEYTKIVLGEVLKKSYVFSKDFAADNTLISMNLIGVKPALAEKQLYAILDQNGYTARTLDEFVYIDKRSDKHDVGHDSIFIYRPKYRTVNYLFNLVGGFFSEGRFSFQRGIPHPNAVPGPVNSAQSGNASNGTSPVAAPVVDTGTSAYSAIDKPADRLVYAGPASAIEKLKKLLAELDLPKDQVTIKAAIYEVNKTIGDASGFSLAASVLSGKLGIKGNVGAGDTSSGLGASLSLGPVSVDAVINALNSDSRFKEVSAPFVRVDDGQLGHFNVGSSTPTIGGTVLSSTGSAVQNVTYRDSGITLDITPKVFGRSIDLDIQQELSSFIPTTNGVTGSPTLNKRDIRTTVTAKDGEVFMIGGLSDSTDSAGHARQRFFPWIGSSSSSSNVTDIVLVLQVKKL